MQNVCLDFPFEYKYWKFDEFIINQANSICKVYWIYSGISFLFKLLRVFLFD